MLASIPVDEIRRRGSIRDSDVVALRAAYTAHDEITAEDADALFDIHAATPIQDPSWTDLFIEIVSDFIIEQSAPAGYMVEENSRWLIERVSTFGRIETTSELALLLNVLECARWSPPTLAAFALDQIRHAVQSGKGPLRSGRRVPDGTISAAEVALAGRILSAFGRETNLAITRTEAEALIAINRAIPLGGASPAWSELLVRTVGSGVLASLGHAVAPRREIIESLGNPDGASELIAMLLGDTAGHLDQTGYAAQSSAAACRIWRSARLLTSEERALVRLERQRLEIVTNEVIEETTDVWLIDTLARSRPDDETEAALLGFILREASQLSPEIEQYARRRAIAA